MDFTFTEEQELMTDSLRKAYEANYEFDKRQVVLEDTAATYSIEMWKDLAENGFIGLLAPEESGGVGGEGTDLMAVALEMSRHLALEPFLSTSVMGVRALVRAGTELQKTKIFPEVLSGESNLAVALYEPGQRYNISPVSTYAKMSGGQYIINGEKAVVVGGDNAKWIAIGAKLEGGNSSVFLIDGDANGLNRNAYRLVDGRGAADLKLLDVSVSPDFEMPNSCAEMLLSEIEDWAITASLAETLGAMEMARDLTHDYLSTREQFGRPIGSFQVLQHSMVEVLSDVEFARSMVYWAASEVTNVDGNKRRKVISGSKAYVDNAARSVAERCVQLHGGLGVTDEYVLSHYVKRLTLGQVLFGDRDEHLLRYSDIKS